ncbi:TPA: hypothetical protein NIA45_004725 [Pseudomonas aeruginosa]|nr:hypothetical protein [Pseudomonas aeruginosa]
MNTQAQAPRFTNYDDVIKALEAAQSKNALSDLADQVDAEYSNGRLDLTPANWGDFASRMVLRGGQIEEHQASAPATSTAQEAPVTVIATYVSVWDGSVNLETPCVIDLATGLVEAALVDSTGLASCDLEFVRLADGQEFEVTAGEGMVADLGGFQLAAKALATAQPVDPVLLAIEVLQALRPDLAAAVQELAVKAEAAGAAPAEPYVPVVVIESGGGVIHCIRSSAPVEIIQLDADVEDGDPDSQVLLNVGEQEYELNVRQYREVVTGGHEGVDVEFCHLVRDQAAAKLAECA